MPKAKATRGRLKTISCPRCRKRFYSETNVLRHLNQPTGHCYGASWYQDSNYFNHSNHDLDPPSSGANGIMEPDIRASLSPNLDSQQNFDYFPFPLSEDAPACDRAERDDEMDGAGEKFVETFPNCSNSYAGGLTFMDQFWQDEYAEQRRENLFFPFASSGEWEFSSWCLRSGLSMAAIDSLLSLQIIKRLSLSFRTAKDLRGHVESLPTGPRWLCKPLTSEAPTKRPVRLFYRPALECLQSLLSHPLLYPHISFVPRRVWTSAARICRIYEDWLSGECAWEIQEKLPEGATTLGVILSSDKTNISVISGNRMAYPLLISLANIDPAIRSKISMHTYLLLALLPVAKFTHKDARTRGLLHDRLTHRALHEVLEPLKIAARVGVMMNDPAGNVRYCYTPLAAYIGDTPELSLVACTNIKASPLTTATSKQFGDRAPHPPRTGSRTLLAIREAYEKCSPQDFKSFLKVAKTLFLNGMTDPFWVDWPLSCPAMFLHLETLHHFHRFSWDHDVKWSIEVVTAAEIDFRFSLIQPTIGYRAFEEGISNLKQVTGRDHRSIQRYLLGVIAGAVPRRFLVAIRALAEFRYLAQAPIFTDQSLEKLTNMLELFHDHKDAVTQAGARKDSWEIPKLELLQSVVSSIRRSGPVMQWSADATKHAHIQEVKVPARLGNNQNHYDQIARHLDRSDKCFRFDIATYIATWQETSLSEEDGGDLDIDHEDDRDESDLPLLHDHMKISRSSINYFVISDAIARGYVPNVPRPPRTFATATSAFHITSKPSIRTTLDEAAALCGIADLRPALCEFLQRVQGHTNVHDISGVRTHAHRLEQPFNDIQVWYKLRIQQRLYHDNTQVDRPQTLRAFPPSDDFPHGRYDAVVVSPGAESDWPRQGIEGHLLGQLRLVFNPKGTDYLLAYIQRFDIVTQRGFTNNIHPGTGMHLLRRATRSNGTRIGDIVPISHIRSAAHLVPNFGKEAHPRLSRQNAYELSTDFWLNKFWSKEFYYALSLY